MSPAPTSARVIPPTTRTSRRGSPSDIPGAFFADQFNNPANPLAHERTTGPEIWAQMGHDVDAIVCGVGSGGTITGLTRFFRSVRPELGFVLADPVGSIVAEYTRSGAIGTAGSWAVEGIGEDFIPTIADLSGVRAAYSIADAESFGTARELLRSRRHPRRLVDRHAARRGAALLPLAQTGRSASSASSATPAPAISPRSTTTSG